MLRYHELSRDHVEEMGAAVQTFLRSQASHEEPAIVRIEGDRSGAERESVYLSGVGIPEDRCRLAPQRLVEVLPGRLPDPLQRPGSPAVAAREVSKTPQFHPEELGARRLRLGSQGQDGTRDRDGQHQRHHEQHRGGPRVPLDPGPEASQRVDGANSDRLPAGESIEIVGEVGRRRVSI